MLPPMTSLNGLIATLSAQPGPVVTVYSHERVELSGPVVARWLAKIANLLGTELSNDLFDDSFINNGAGGIGAFLEHFDASDETGNGVSPEQSPIPSPRIFVDTGLWQRILWEIASGLMGWELLDTPGMSVSNGTDTIGPRLLPGDAMVTHSVSTLSTQALLGGAWVLFQSPDYLSFSWNGEDYDEGGLDALQEIMAQPDTLIVSAPQIAPSAEQLRDDLLLRAGITETNIGSNLSAGTTKAHLPVHHEASSSEIHRPLPEDVHRVAVIARQRSLSGLVLSQWLAQRSVVVIDPHTHSPSALHTIVEAEKVNGPLLNS